MSDGSGRASRVLLCHYSGHLPRLKESDSKKDFPKHPRDCCACVLSFRVATQESTGSHSYFDLSDVHTGSPLIVTLV